MMPVTPTGAYKCFLFVTFLSALFLGAHTSPAIQPYNVNNNNKKKNGALHNNVFGAVGNFHNVY